MMMRSGQLKSSTAQPSVKNMGCETMMPFNFAFFSERSSPAAVPMGTGVTSEKVMAWVEWRAIRRTSSSRS